MSESVVMDKCFERDFSYWKSLAPLNRITPTCVGATEEKEFKVQGIMKRAQDESCSEGPREKKSRPASEIELDGLVEECCKSMMKRMRDENGIEDEGEVNIPKLQGITRELDKSKPEGLNIMKTYRQEREAESEGVHRTAVDYDDCGMSSVSTVNSLDDALNQFYKSIMEEGRLLYEVNYDLSLGMGCGTGISVVRDFIPVVKLFTKSSDRAKPITFTMLDFQDIMNAIESIYNEIIEKQGQIQKTVRDYSIQVEELYPRGCMIRISWWSSNVLYLHRADVEKLVKLSPLLMNRLQVLSNMNFCQTYYNFIEETVSLFRENTLLPYEDNRSVIMRVAYMIVERYRDQLDHHSRMCIQELLVTNRDKFVDDALNHHYNM